MIYTWLLVLLLVACTPKYKTIVVPVEHEPEFNLCEPLRGEDQSAEAKIKGRAYDSVAHGCI